MITKDSGKDKVQVWGRVTRGLEWVAAAEALLIPGVKNLKTEHRDLTFYCNNFDDTLTLRCCDDVFFMWQDNQPIPHTRDGLQIFQNLLKKLPVCPIHIPLILKNLRITASFLGKRNYNRYELEDIAGAVLSPLVKLPYQDSHQQMSPTSLSIRIHLSNNYTRIGIRTFPYPLHRRKWRTEGLKGALHPPIAAAMTLLADFREGQTIVDPFCGSGTLLIEAGLRCPNLTLYGYDLSFQAKINATEHSQRTNIPLIISQEDSTHAQFPLTDRVISNPPWGIMVQAGGQLTTANLLPTLLNNLKPNGKAVLLADQELGLQQLIEQTEYKVSFVQSLRISGRLTDLIIIGSSFKQTQTELGKRLNYAWEHYRYRDKNTHLDF